MNEKNLKDFKITKNELILLHLTLKNMKKGMSFDDSFKTAMDSITHSAVRLMKGTKRHEIAEKYLFQELYKAHGDKL